MKKTLVIVAHPNLDASIGNKAWVSELKKHPNAITVHDIYGEYPNGKIDVEKEQRLIDAHGSVVFQFPMYWFNCPPLLKQWFDEVLTYGWAYGSSGIYMKDKKVALAVSTGLLQHDYALTGRCEISLASLLQPFELSMRYCHANYQGVFAMHGLNNEPDENIITHGEIEQNAKDYIAFVLNL